jgi:prepilin-type N-terminal cleavage/methylation domain-containing protein
MKPASLFCTVSQTPHRHWFAINSIFRSRHFLTGSVFRSSRQASRLGAIRTRGFTLVEMTVVIAVILVLVGAASLGVKPYYAYRDGRSAGEYLRAVKAAQLMYLSDNPSAAVTSLTQALLLPYMPNGTWPTLPMVGTVQPTINCTVFPPVALLSGATYPSASPAATDGLWNVGQY